MRCCNATILATHAPFPWFLIVLCSPSLLTFYVSILPSFAVVPRYMTTDTRLLPFAHRPLFGIYCNHLSGISLHLTISLTCMDYFWRTALCLHVAGLSSLLRSGREDRQSTSFQAHLSSCRRAYPSIGRLTCLEQHPLRTPQRLLCTRIPAFRRCVCRVLVTREHDVRRCRLLRRHDSWRH